MHYFGRGGILCSDWGRSGCWKVQWLGWSIEWTRFTSSPWKQLVDFFDLFRIIKRAQSYKSILSLWPYWSWRIQERIRQSESVNVLHDKSASAQCYIIQIWIAHLCGNVCDWCQGDLGHSMNLCITRLGGLWLLLNRARWSENMLESLMKHWVCRDGNENKVHTKIRRALLNRLFQGSSGL